MINHVWSLVSRESKIDAETNSLSINDIYEELTIDIEADKAAIESGQPIPLPIPFEVTSTFFRPEVDKKEECTVRVGIEDPNQKEISYLQVPLTFEVGMSRMRTRLKSPTFHVTKAGIYTFRVSIENPLKKSFKELAVIPITVKLSMKVREANAS